MKPSSLSKEVSSLFFAVILLLCTYNCNCATATYSSYRNILKQQPNLNILSLRGGSSSSPKSSFDPTSSSSSSPSLESINNHSTSSTIEVTESSSPSTTTLLKPTQDREEQVSCNSSNIQTTTTTNTTSKTATTTSASSSIINNPKLQNAIERTGPALLMLFLLYLLIKNTGEYGLIFLLIPLMQFGMYKETTGIIENYYNQKTTTTTKHHFDLEVNIEKWWWFITFFISTSGRLLLSEMQKIGTVEKIVPTAILSFLNSKDKMDLICFGMVSVGLVMAVVGMATHSDSNAKRFRSYLGEVASFHFVLIFLVGQSSYWIKTIQSFGIGWLLYPALLVVVNDTMAYVFGVLFGKHKLLPKLSPKKTVEGFVGAAVSTIGISIPLLKLFVSFIGKRSDGELSNCFEKFSSVFFDPQNAGDIANSHSLRDHAIVMAMYTSLISPFGGFLASSVKRAHGAKDFGALIPGHGGVVDRFDCQVVTAPFVYLYLKWCLSDY